MQNEIATILECLDNVKNIIATNGNKNITFKQHNEIVTNYDIAINKAVNDVIYRQYPNDAIIGEELSINQNSNTGRLWLIDPIDGTRSFVDGVDGYSFMVSLIIDGVPYLSLSHSFSEKQTFVVQKEVGIKILTNGVLKEFHQPLTKKKNLIWNPYSDNKLKNYLIRAAKLNDKVVESESWGQRMIDFIKGKGSLSISMPNSSKIWDTAFASLVVSEAGGTITDINGNFLLYNKKHTANKVGTVCSYNINHKSVLLTIKKFLANKEQQVHHKMSIH